MDKSNYFIVFMFKKKLVYPFAVFVMRNFKYFAKTWKNEFWLDESL